MTLKNAIITLIVVILVAAGVVLYLNLFADEKGGLLEEEEEGEMTNTFFPVDSSSTTTNVTPSEQPQQGGAEINIPKLRQISNVPVAGFVTFERDVDTSSILFNEQTQDESFADETETVFRYIERSTGNIYETTARNLSIERITNTTIPKIYEALFTDDGEGVVLRYLDNGNSIESFVATVQEPEVDDDPGTVDDERVLSELIGAFLPKNITTITKSPDGKTFFYVVRRDDESSGYTFNIASPQAGKLIYRSKMTQLVSEWYRNDRINIYTKPSNALEGFSFVLNPQTQGVTKIFDNVLGLITKISPDGLQALFSITDAGTTKTGIYDMNTGEISFLNTPTLAEKCIWGNEKGIIYCAVPNERLSSNLPDAWYQGVVSFSDKLYKIDLDADTVAEVPNLQGSFDIINPQLSADGDYLTFMNKKDLTLWSLDIKD